MTLGVRRGRHVYVNLRRPDHSSRPIAVRRPLRFRPRRTARSTIGGAGDSVTVTRTTNVGTVTFGGGVLAGADQPQMIAVGGGGTTAVAATPTDGFGGTVVDMGAQMQIQGSLTVAGESLTIGTGVMREPCSQCHSSALVHDRRKPDQQRPDHRE